MDVPEEAMGEVSQLFQKRKGILTSYEPFPGQNEASKNAFVWNSTFRHAAFLEHVRNF
ncbi:MAG: hypothetical protein R2877_06895 [Bdellovibrionota bacterium]